MINMGQKQAIIIGHFSDGKSARALSRDLGINRRTVQKYIDEHKQLLCRGDGPIPAKGIVDPPRYCSTGRIRRALTAEVRRKLDGYLELNAQRRKAGLGKQQMKRTDMHEELLAAGHQIGYNTVCTYVRGRLQASQEAFIRQVYSPGQSVEFDWGEVRLNLGGQLKRLMLAVFTSAYSNHRYALLFYRQDMVSFLSAHAAYFTAVGGVAGELVYDNMRVAVRRFACRNEDKEATEDLLRLSAYYGFRYRFCNARRGNEKGHVERSVEYVRRKAFSQHIEFADLASANAHLGRRLEVLNQRPAKGQESTITQRFAEEQAMMKPLPIQPFDASEVRLAKVDKYCCVRIDNNYYSVSDHLVGQYVQARVHALHIELYDRQSEQLLATHQRRHTSHQYYMQLAHFLPTLCQKPGALLGSLAWQQADQCLQQLLRQHFDEAQPQLFIELLRWTQQHHFPYTDLQQAVEHLHGCRPHLPVEPEAVKIYLQAKSRCPIPGTAKKSGALRGAISRQAQQQLQQHQQLFNLSKTA